MKEILTGVIWILCGIGIFVTFFMLAGFVIGVAFRFVLNLILDNHYTLLSFTSVWTGWAVLILGSLIKWMKS